MKLPRLKEFLALLNYCIEFFGIWCYFVGKVRKRLGPFMTIFSPHGMYVESLCCTPLFLYYLT